MNKHHILFITPLPPPVHGSAMVSKYIKDSRIIGEEFECDFVNLSTSRRMDEIGKGGVKKLLRFVGSFFLLFYKLVIHRYDLCYLAITCHGMGFLKDAPFVLLCKLFGRKVVIHQHNKGMQGCVDKWPYRWLLPLVYKNTTVILLSWYLYPDIEKVVRKEQVVICPNGIPEIPGTMAKIKRRNEVTQLFFLSNLIESKGVYVLLDACKILKDKGYSFGCNFVGGESKGINRELFEEEVCLRGLADVVSYSGPKYGEEKNEYWKTSDVFVQPTFNDCFPLTLVEAMQQGLPIISTNEGGIPDIVKDGVNGFVCERKDVGSLAQAIERLLKDKELRERMGEEGYKIYRDNFTLQCFEEKMRDILKMSC